MKSINLTIRNSK